METIDDEVADARIDYIKRQHAAGKPFFVWCNFTHMHVFTHTKPESRGPGRAVAVAVPRHDDRPRQATSAQVLDVLDELGIADDTIVIYSTDNGPHMNTWPDAGTTPVPQREEHQLGGRLPGAGDDPLARKDPGGQRLQRDHPAPRLAADVPGRRRRPRRRWRSSRRATRSGTIDLQGPHRRLQPAALPDWARSSTARGVASSTSPTTATWWPCASRTGRSCSWSSAVQGTLQIWAEPFIPLRVPKLFNLRTDPFEYADITSNTY